MHNTLTSRLIGFFGSIVLTLTAFLLVIHPDFFHVEIRTAFALIFILAILQAIVQSIFFLNVLSEKGTRWNLIVFASTLSIIIIIIAGAIWIMGHLESHMMHMQ